MTRSARRHLHRPGCAIGALSRAAECSARVTRRSRSARVAAVTTLAALAVWGAPLATTATAKVEEVNGTKVGLQPPDSTTRFDGFFKRTLNEAVIANAGAESFANAAGNPVLHAVGIYAVYWDPQGFYHGDWQEVIDTFLSRLGASTGQQGLFSVQSQYSDRTGQHAGGRVAFDGAAVDTSPYPTASCTNPHPFALLVGKFPSAPSPDCLTDAQVREQLSSYIASHGLPRGPGTIYDVLTPPGVAVCLDEGGPTGHCSEYERSNEASYNHSFCSYHSFLGANESEAIVYDMIPWTAGGLADDHLADEDQTSASECQDGGFNPVSGGHEAAPLEQQPSQIGLGPDGTYDHGLADLIVNQVAVEEQDTVTDPFLNAWQDAEGDEATDECRNYFSPKLGGGYGAQEGTDAGTLYDQVISGGNYYLNLAFSLTALKLNYPGVPCLPGISLQPEFTVPTPVNVGEVVGFDGMESGVTLNWAGPSLTAPGQTYATFTWNFGDGTAPVTGYAPGSPVCSAPWLSPCAGSVFHTYTSGGEYVVKLTIKDTGGHEATVEREVLVNGPPAPASSGSSAGATGATGATGAKSGPAYPAPTARAAAASGSLRAALRHGLTIRYKVNEQVAGVAEALISAKLARRLHIHGRRASGLPAGYPQSVVIGRAVLVTRKGGTGAVRLRFSKSTAKALRKLRKVTITLRLVLRNAEQSNPKTTTLISKIVLKSGHGRSGHRSRQHRRG